MSVDLSTLQEAVNRHLEIRFAVVFGSVAQGKERPNSDLDLAVRLDPQAFPSAWELGGLAADLADAVGRKVDLAILDQLRSALLRHEISKGILLKGTHEEWVEFRRRSFREWREFAPRFQRYTEAAIRKGLRAK